MCKAFASLALGVVVAFGVAISVPAQAADVTPGILYNMGGKFDKSFNEAAFNGAENFRKSTDIAYMEFEPTTEAQREQALRNMARRGANIIVAVSFAQTSAVETVAAELPEVKFTLIDGVVDAPNVQSVVFKEHEGSFLVGMLAAMASQSGKVGFIGGMDIPLIRRFACGYEQGVKFINPGASVYQNMTGSTPAAWNDPAKGAELAAELRGELYELDDERFETLRYAIAHHTDGTTSEDVTIGTCWDADRLDLLRLGKKVQTSRLSTATARRPELLRLAEQLLGKGKRRGRRSRS